MKTHEPTKFGNGIALLAGLDLLLFAVLVGVTLGTGEGGARLFSLLLTICLLVEGILWIMAVIHILRIFLHTNANDADVFLGVAEAILVLALTPVLFRLGTAMLSHPENILVSFQDAGLIRLWGISRFTNLYLLFVRLLGLRWMNTPEPSPLTMADVSNPASDATSESEE